MGARKGRLGTDKKCIKWTADSFEKLWLYEFVIYQKLLKHFKKCYHRKKHLAYISKVYLAVKCSLFPNNIRFVFFCNVLSMFS